MLKINIIIKLIVAIIFVVSIAGAIVFTFKDKVEASAKKIYQKQNALTANERRESNMVQLRADYQTVKQALSLVKNILPEEKNIGKIVDDLESLALQSNNVQDLNFTPSSQSENMELAKSINFSATLTGNSESFVLYFRGLKKLPYLIEIENITISNNSGVSNNNTKMNYAAKVFIKK